jgi:hypothetical protein
MAYIDKHFNAIGGETRSGVNGTLFYYRTEDNEATLVAPDYFNSLKSILKKGDIIEVLAEVDDVNSPSTSAGILILMVTNIAGNVVTVTKQSIL